MSSRKRPISAALFASALVFAVATDVEARGGGGGGHGGGGGGGHFGGGGGGMHFGGGGGGMHFGGGGIRFGGMRLGGSHFGGLRLGGRRFHVGGRNFHVGGRSYAQRGLGARHFAGSTAHQHSFAARNVGHAAVAGALGTGHLAGRNFEHNGLHGPFTHPFNGFRGFSGYGWYGPVFWPYAYDVLFADLFWGSAYGYPFWDYGYSDIYSGLFWPYGYDDLVGFLPGGPGVIGGAYAGVSRPSSGLSGASSRALRAKGQPAVTVQLNQMCGEDSKEVAGWPIDRIEEAVTPTADQRAALNDFANASVRAAQTIREACPTTVSFAPTGRLDAMQKRIEGMAQAVDIVGPPLNKFYNSLTDEQKARLNAANDQTGKSRSLANCGAVNNATQWPGERIEKAVQPNEQQQAKLDALKTAMASASDHLAKTCPAALPVTPPARLTAMSTRLDTMLQSVKSVRGALDDFYNSLSDEQKAQFDLIGRQQTAQKQS
jgi:hypothetical protein